MQDLRLGHRSAQRATERRLLGDILLERGAVRSEILKEALRQQKRDHRLLGDLLLERGVAERDLVSALSLQTGCATVDLDVEVPSDEALLSIDGPTARRLGILPLSLDAAGSLHLAISPLDGAELREAVRGAIGREVVLHLAGRRAVELAIDRHYGV